MVFSFSRDTFGQILYFGIMFGLCFCSSFPIDFRIDEPCVSVVGNYSVLGPTKEVKEPHSTKSTENDCKILVIGTLRKK